LWLGSGGGEKTPKNVNLKTPKRFYWQSKQTIGSRSGDKRPKNVNLKTPKRFGEQFRQKMDNPSTLRA